jgi:uncharacterized integral membrane protein
MRSTKLILLLIVAAAIVAVVLQNQAPWQVRFLWLTGEVSGIILLFLTAAAGFIAGIIVVLLKSRDSKSEHKIDRR